LSISPGRGEKIKKNRALGIANYYNQPEDMYTHTFDFATPEYDDAVRLRHQVLREPLGMVYLKEDLEKEYDQIHLGCYADSGQLLACLSLQDLGDKQLKMRQVVVEPSLQKKGIGQFLVAASERLALQLGYSKMVLHARDTAIPFYVKLGYKKTGRAFKEVNIKHYKMAKDLKTDIIT
jgi:predicted GNAT family N-acyltransferase